MYKTTKIVGSLSLTLFLVVTGAVAFTYSGLLDVAATTREPEIVQWLLENTRKNSIRYRAEQIAVPELSGKERLATGSKAFEEMCSACHGAPGKKPFLGTKDMNPPPPDLADAASQRTPKELFWVVKNGIRMTGMPAWGPTHTDKEIWNLVAFMNQLPEISPDAYRNLINSEWGEEHSHNPEDPVQGYEGTHGSDANDHAH
jgi:mono/diheme cytochrome c family protein